MWFATNSFVVIPFLLFIKRGRGKALKAGENRESLVIKSENKSNKGIPEALGRSRDVITEYLKDPA